MQKIFSLILSMIITISSYIPGLISGELKPKDFIEEVKMEFVEKYSDNFGISKRVFSVFFEDSTTYRQAKSIIKNLGGKIVGYNSFLNEYKVFFDNDIEDVEAFCSELQIDERIILAMPQLVFNAKALINEDTEKQNNDFIGDTGEGLNDYNFIPDDPFDGENVWDESNPAGNNWHLEAIEALSAWQYLDRMNEVDLGIIDSGFDLNHEDIQNKIDFPNNYLKRTNSFSNHGTHVAGIISADINNGIGVCGVCPKAKLHCVDWDPTKDRISQFWFDFERIYTGVIATIKDGAKAVNLSLGSDMTGVEVKYPDIVVDFVGTFSSSIMSVLIKRGYDFIICQSAGNGNHRGYAVDAENNLTFCAVNENNCASRLFGVDKNEVLDRLIVVGSATIDGDGDYYQPYYSNVGDRVDICAPGDSIYSTVMTSDGGYGYMSGTSMAAPIVTAVCGLVWSIDSSFTGPEVKKIICSDETSCNRVKATVFKRYDEVNYRDYNLINAKLCVEKAIEISENR